MKRLFLDTNVYNHIADVEAECVKQSIEARQFEVLTTPQILAELAATFKKDKALAVRLCNIYADLISDDVLQPPPVLIQTEISSVLKGDRSTVLYLQGENKMEFFSYVEKLKSGNIDLYVEQFIDRIGRLKKEQFRYSKLRFSKIEPHVLEEPLKKYPTFHQFLMEGIRRGERLKELERYVVKDFGKNTHQAAKFIEKRLGKTPHLGIALRVVPALSYYYHVEKNKPKHGDIFDCSYFVCLATVDGFVSDDEGARYLFRLICPHKQCLSLADFINLLA